MSVRFQHMPLKDVPTLLMMYSVHILASTSLKIHFNIIIFHLRQSISSCRIALRFLIKIAHEFLFSTIRAAFLTHFIFLISSPKKLKLSHYTPRRRLGGEEV
jgi:hypothetical protein